MILVALAYALFLAGPILLLLVGSFGTSWSNTLLPQGVTMAWYASLVADPSFRRAFQTSLEVMALTCVLNAIVGFPLAYAMDAAARNGVRSVGRVLVLLPIAVPELVLAFGFILIFSSDTLPWLGSFWLLLGGHLVVTLPYTISALSADMEQLDLAGLERAAAALGASPLARLRDVVLPMLRGSLVSAMLTVAALSVGEFQLSNLIAGFLSRTYPVVLLQAFYGATGFACAATVVLLALAVIAGLGSGIAARLLSPERSERRLA